MLGISWYSVSPFDFRCFKPFLEVSDGDGVVVDGILEKGLHKLKEEDAAVREVGLLLNLESTMILYNITGNQHTSTADEWTLKFISFRRN